MNKLNNYYFNVVIFFRSSLYNMCIIDNAKIYVHCRPTQCSDVRFLRYEVVLELQSYRVLVHVVAALIIVYYRLRP